MEKDALTGVYSRSAFKERFREEIDRARRYGESLTIFLIDLDHFKSINDAFGHTRGDQVLVELSERLRSVIRSYDLVFRYGGDEFLTLLPHTNKEESLKVAQRFIDVIGAEPFSGAPPLSLSVSIGIATFPDDVPNPDELFDVADIRLFEAKRKGRGQFVAENPPSKVDLPFDEISRLIERDEALLEMNKFFEVLPEREKGVLKIIGPKASGRTRLLSEVIEAAKIRKYNILHILGLPSLKSRRYGALHHVMRKMGYSSPSYPVEGFIRVAQKFVEEKFHNSIAIVVDNLPDLDWGTLEFIRHFALLSELQPLAIIYATDPESSRRWNIEIPFTNTIELTPLSLQSVRIWMREILQWEPPEEFINWLYHNTNGLPGNIRRAVLYLVERGILKRINHEWKLEDYYQKTPIAERFGFEAKVHPMNLPVILTEFIGRENEIQQAQKLIQEKRLLTIQGLGGIGKTRLSIEVARELVDYFVDGVFFVPLAPLTSADQIAPAIAQSIDFRFSGKETPENQLVNHLKNKEMLLLLDNFEHIIEGAELVGKILENCPKIKIIATSRERLGLEGEAILELKGLEIPSEDNIERAEEFTAVQLFINRAQRAQATFVLKDEDKPYVNKICNLVDGIPLAIELAAAWIRVLSCKEILEEIEANIDMLLQTAKDMPARQRGMRGVFEYSWNLLSDEERRAFKKLSVFQGGFTRQAAQKVAGASLSLLSSLVDKSLIKRNLSGRYEVHELIKQYVAEKLEENPIETEKTRDLHCEYYLKLVAEKDPEIVDYDEDHLLREIEQEFNNIKTAWERGVKEEKIHLLGEASKKLWRFCDAKGRYKEACELLLNAVEKFSAIEIADSYEKEAFAYIISGSADCLNRLGRYNDAKELTEKGMTLVEKDKPSNPLVSLLIASGTTLKNLGDLAKAKEHYEKALALAQELKNKKSQAIILSSLGVFYGQIGNLEMSVNFHKEALGLFRERGDSHSVAVTLINIAECLAHQEKFEEAQKMLSESIEILKIKGDNPHLARAFIVLGNMYIGKGEHSEARDSHRKALLIARGIDSKDLIISSLLGISNSEKYTGNLENAIDAAQEALYHAKEINDTFDIAHCLFQMAGIETQMEKYDDAEMHLVESLKISINVGIIQGILYNLLYIGNLYYTKKEFKKAYIVLSAIVQHPNVFETIKNACVQLISEIEKNLSPSEISSLKEEVSQLTLESVVDRIIASSGK